MRRHLYRITSTVNGWVVRVTGEAPWPAQRTQADAVRMATKEARELGAARSIWCQVVLHGKDGRIRWERTYPRSSDPRRSKG